ncbi:secretin N-terminal domain-containing protein [Pseudoalteromonas xiamenensis]|uniref:secretin N-terminal domain-containing protein n=1 Tax=Pseudoalteromonas xiamenensis TaxID=882626 RepID=UPI0035E907FD
MAKLNLKLAVVLPLLLTACKSTEPHKLQVGKSYLNEGAQSQSVTKGNAALSANSALSNTKEASYFQVLQSANWGNTKLGSAQEVLDRFSADEKVTLSVDELAVKDFLHYVFGDVLKVSYIIGDEASADPQTLTLNVQEQVSKQKLYQLSEELLTQKGYVVRFNDGIFYIHKAEQGGKAAVVFGYGFTAESVPDSAQDIVQFIPFRFGRRFSIIGAINELFNVQASSASENDAMKVMGKRREILKVIDFVSILDRPTLVNKQIAFFRPVYASVNAINEELQNVLKEEGIIYSSKGDIGTAVSAVLLERSGAMVLFANEKSILARVEFWLRQLDQPTQGNDKKYHVYQPEFARATDLGQSLSVLIGGAGFGSGQPTASTSARSEDARTSSSNAGNSTNKTMVATGSDIKMVVDERSNSLIIESSGQKYRDLLPLIKRLDVMPKQVLLEVIIAEVTLTGSFEQGVAFTLTNQSETNIVSRTLTGASGSLNYLLKGGSGDLTLKLLESNSNVEVLSRPSVVVRDGVSASITAGDSIPTVSKIVSDGLNGNQQSVERLKAGVQLSVTPTINAQGVVLMEISQSISNASKSSSAVQGAPIITERAIETEVVAESGQTVVLGGLIRESNTNGDGRIPVLSDIPILGRLFDSTSRQKDKVELVVMVTPKIIEDSNDWDMVRKQFQSQFQYLELEGN